jgi:MYXO-CTERM domain-containing protein
MYRFATLLLLASGCLAPQNVGEAQQAIVGGTTDTADPGVVLVLKDQGNQGSICTGEVLSAHVVLTAAHCVDPAVVGTTGTFKVYAGDNLNQARSSDFLAVKETHFNPDFNVNNLQGGNDIAVVITTNPMTIAPLKMNRTPIDQAMVGSAVRFVGYGITSASDTTGTTSGIKRQTTSSLGGFTDVLLEFNDGRHITCEGDSGGPGLMNLDGSGEVIVGITSFGDQGCMQFGADTRIDVFADSFVQPFIDMFDPPPPPPPVVPGPDGFDPGEVGATCANNGDCKSQTCAMIGDTGFCTAMCDPSNASSCPMGTHCGTIGADPYCVRDSRNSGGCSTAPGARGSAGVLFLALAALALIARRRRLI